MNFNYTNTYERTYSINEEKPKVFHVHGECNAGKTMEDNNMVLGIDEYLKDERKDIHTNFSIFKKFVQRIRKRTGAGIYTIFEEVEYLYKNFSYESTIMCLGILWTKQIKIYCLNF